MYGISGESHIVKTNKDCPQEEVLSLLLWTLVVNSFLKVLPNSNIDVLSYADDLTIMERGKPSSTHSELTQAAVKK